MAKSKVQIKESISLDIPDNVTQKVSPADIRDNLLDMVDNAHLLTEGESILAGNFSTPETRNTRVGEESIMNLDLPGHENSDNTALGYYTMRPIYTGSYNTGLGSYSLGSNVFGHYNSSVGFHALGGVIRGSGNVGFGPFTLNNNTDGDYNIAIGHGAGYWVGENDSYRFFLGSHPVDESGICENPEGSGEVALMMGDMLDGRLALNSSGLRNTATFEVNNLRSDRIQEWYDRSGVLVAWIDNSGTLYHTGDTIAEVPAEFGWTSWFWDGVLASGDTYLQQIFDKVDNLFPRLDYSEVSFSGNLDSGDNTIQKVFDRLDQKHRPVEMKFVLTDETTVLDSSGDIFSFNADFDFLLTSVKTRTNTGSDAEYGITVNGQDILSGVLYSSGEFDFYSGGIPPSYGISIAEDDLITVSIEASGTNNTGLKMTLRGATPYTNSPYYNGSGPTWDDIY